ncbi:CHAT domain-containing protein [Nostoc sp.]|uniref:CHAT domain-containing protein n=1 Tax=Nostoc sp. TaxID=1180 RepID=UPI002FF80E8F
MASDPSDAARLHLGQELRDIREKLQLAKQRDKFVLESREAVRPGDITQAIFDVDPQIIHFSGHGTSTGELCFEDVLGKVQPVKPEALAALFELVAKQVNCIVLNACYSEIQAKAIVQYVPYVIGTNQAIGDKAAIAFSVGFYKALGANRTIEQAYKFGCVEMQLQGIPEHLTPVLYIQKNSAMQERESATSITTGLTNEFSAHDREILDFFYPCFDRAAFRIPFIIEVPRDMIYAIKHTICALGTGIRKTSDGTIIARGRSKAEFESETLRKQFDEISVHLHDITKVYELAVSTNQLDERLGIVIAKDKAIPAIIDGKRNDVIKIVNNIYTKLNRVAFPLIPDNEDNKFYLFQQIREQYWNEHKDSK